MFEGRIVVFNRILFPAGDIVLIFLTRETGYTGTGTGVSLACLADIDVGIEVTGAPGEFLEGSLVRIIFL